MAPAAISRPASAPPVARRPSGIAGPFPATPASHTATVLHSGRAAEAVQDRYAAAVGRAMREGQVRAMFRWAAHVVTDLAGEITGCGGTAEVRAATDAAIQPARVALRVTLGAVDGYFPGTVVASLEQYLAEEGLGHIRAAFPPTDRDAAANFALAVLDLLTAARQVDDTESMGASATFLVRGTTDLLLAAIAKRLLPPARAAVGLLPVHASLLAAVHAADEALVHVLRGIDPEPPILSRADLTWLAMHPSASVREAAFLLTPLMQFDCREGLGPSAQWG